MQIIKYLLFLIVLSVISIAIYITTLESKFSIDNSYTLPYKTVYIKNYFNDVLNWENVTHTNPNDTLFTNNNSFEIQKNISIKLDSVSPNLSLFSVHLGNENIGKISYHYTDSINKFTKVNAKFYGEVTFIDKVNIFLKGISPGFYFDRIFTNLNEKIKNQLTTDFSYNNFAPIKLVYIPKTYYYKSLFAHTNLSREHIIDAYHQVKNQIGEKNIANNTFFIDLVLDQPNRKEYYIGIPVNTKLGNKISNDIYLDSLKTDKVLKTAYTGDIEFEKKYLETVKKQVEEQQLNIDFSNKINVWNDYLKYSNPKAWTFETWYYVNPEPKKQLIFTNMPDTTSVKEFTIL